MLPSGAVVRVVFADGRVAEGIIARDRPTFVVPDAPRPWDILAAYVRLGVGHILAGPDHLLFVFGLVLLAGATRRLLATVTAFTLGHSVTLTAAALGLVAVPVDPIEVAIAASVFVLAVELARDPGRASAIRRRPWVMAFAFGLLHGFGFAGALAEAGLPGDEIPLALLGFNLGIEAGQVAFVACVLAAGAALWPLAHRAPVVGALGTRVRHGVAGRLLVDRAHGGAVSLGDVRAATVPRSDTGARPRSRRSGRARAAPR